MSLRNLTNTDYLFDPPKEQTDWVNHFLGSIEEPNGSLERGEFSTSAVTMTQLDHRTTSTLSNITVSSKTPPRWSSKNFRPVTCGSPPPLHNIRSSPTTNISSQPPTNISSQPPPTNITFFLQYPAAENLPSEEQPIPTPAVSSSSTPPTPEKTFFEKHNIMKWVIDDEDDGDILGLTSSQVGLENMKLEVDNDVRASTGARKRISLLETSQSEDQPRRTKRRSETDPSKLTEGEVSALKYNRIRRLNNESSRRCRLKKKLQQDLLLKELEDQRVQHAILKERCEALESKVRNMKTFFVKHFKDPQKEIAMARQRIIFGDKINDDILRRIVVTKDLPDISSIWSNLH